MSFPALVQKSDLGAGPLLKVFFLLSSFRNRQNYKKSSIFQLKPEFLHNVSSAVHFQLVSEELDELLSESCASLLSTRLWRAPLARLTCRARWYFPRTLRQSIFFHRLNVMNLEQAVSFQNCWLAILGGETAFPPRVREETFPPCSV